MNYVHDGSAPNVFSRDLILASAREIFVAEGYEGFSIRKLAKTVGCAVGTVYLQFSNKEDLFRSLVEQSFDRLHQSLSALRDRHEGGNPVLLLKKALYTYVEFGLRNPNDYRFAFLLRPPVQDQPYRPHPAFEVMRYMVSRCAAEGAFRPNTDVECASQAVWAAIHGVTSLLIQTPTFPWVSRGKLIQQVINNAVNGLLLERYTAQAAAYS